MSGHEAIRHYSLNAPASQNRNVAESDAWQTIRCAVCGNDVVAAVIADNGQSPDVWWLRCVSCGSGHVRNSDRLSPSALGGERVEGIPGEMEALYSEARRCLGIAAWTATELVCRKLLMHVAVSKGAKEGEPFVSYVKYIADLGYITPAMIPWVDHIRTRGNSATHEAIASSQNDAEDTLAFTAQLLTLVFEMEHKRKRFVAPVVEEASDD